jgi:hypothetical protein
MIIGRKKMIKVSEIIISLLGILMIVMFVVFATSISANLEKSKNEYMAYSAKKEDLLVAQQKIEMQLNSLSQTIVSLNQTINTKISDQEILTAELMQNTKVTTTRKPTTTTVATTTTTTTRRATTTTRQIISRAS